MDIISVHKIRGGSANQFAVSLGWGYRNLHVRVID